MSTAPLTTGAEKDATDATLSPALQKAMARVTEISSLPEITTRIVEVVEDPKSTAQDMRDIVQNDPALAAKILKVVNSAFYGLPSQIASLDRAIVMLGLTAVKNIALAASLSRLFRPGSISDKYSARDLWEHCIGVGVCGRLLAAGCDAQQEEAFVAGLVHDMGLLVEYQLFPDELRTVVERVEAEPQDFCAAERELIGADHQMFGAALATKWKFPPGLRYVISYHHNPERLKPEFRRMATIVHVADVICAQNEIGFHLTAAHEQITADTLSHLGLTEAKIGEFLETLPERIEETKAIFSDE